MTPRTDAGRAGLAALRADPARAVVALDYDGTLAPVVDDPMQAVPAPGAVEAVTALARRVRAVALITGRPAGAVVELAGLHAVPGLVVLGQYGVQRWAAGRLTGPPEHPGLAPLREQLPALLGDAALEDKGHSLVVHTRRCPDPEASQRRLEPGLRDLAARHGLVLHLGRRVLEIRPPGFDKGSALRSLADPAPSAVLFAGDDLGDLPAYDAIEALRRRGVPGVTVCSDSPEGPATLRERADLVLDGPAAVVALLQTLLP